MTPYYESGGITIYHGDCRDIVPHLPPIGLVLTDPPYSSGGQFRSDRTRPVADKYVNSDSLETCRREFTGDNLDQRSFLSWAGMWTSQCHRVAIDGATLLTFTDWRQLPTMTDAIQHGGWVWRNIVTWWKPGIRMQAGRFSLSAEYVVCGSRGVPLVGERSPQNVLTCRPVAGEEKSHLAEKPIDLIVQLIGVSPIGATILDPFMGSGATLVAAKLDGRKAIGIEIEERYCEIAARRLSQAVFEFGASNPNTEVAHA